MTIFSRFRRNPRAALIAALHRRIAEAARDPALYARLGVADTVEGRFACLTLHVVLVLRQLRRLPARDDARLAAVLAEHFDTAPEALRGLARYTLAAETALAARSLEAFLHDGPSLPPPAAFAEEDVR